MGVHLKSRLTQCCDQGLCNCISVVPENDADLAGLTLHFSITHIVWLPMGTVYSHGLLLLLNDSLRLTFANCLSLKSSCLELYCDHSYFKINLHINSAIRDTVK